LIEVGKEYTNGRYQGYQNYCGKHEDGYIAYPLGIKGAVAGQGDTAEAAAADARSAVQEHIDTFGPEVIDDYPVLEVFLTETIVTTK
jgi:predicted RNase H-like HicB family nuclease